MSVFSGDDPDKKNSPEGSGEDQQTGHRISLPGFLVEKEIGLGDIIKRTTSAFGIKPCADCEKRAAILNKWLFFGPGKQK
jgi:hypothetical protein